MSDIQEAFKPLADAYKRQFGIELTGEVSDGLIVVSDGTADGVSRMGSVKSNWLKRNAPKYGFSRRDEGVTFAWTSSADNVEMEPAVEAEESEVAAVTTAASEVGSSDVDFDPQLITSPEEDPSDVDFDPQLLGNDDEDEDDIPEGWRSGYGKGES